MVNKSENMLKNSENSVNSESTLISRFATIEEFTKDGFKTLIEATKNANSLPQDRDWDYYKTHQSFRNLMSNQGENILSLINDVLKQQNVHGNIKSRDFEEKIELIIEANDIILERVANNLDELVGIRKKPEIPVEIQTVSAELPVSGSWNRINNAKIVVTSSASSSKDASNISNSVRLLTAKNIQRSQKFFKDIIDNSKNPWEPRIKDKPNNLKPLAIYLEQTDDGLEEIFCHPYEFELDRFTPQSWQLKSASPQVPHLLELTPLKMVETSEQLAQLLEKLREQKEIAVDLEHHSYRTYLGFTCLMQISTLEEDFIVDALALRDQLHILNEVFTKPTIVKIFHGANNDVLWLQRDFSLYVVNMFDTHQAAKQLGYSQLSLAYLLRRFCKISADKRFQLADWRIRPLPKELVTYAREDTHYLLFISHMMRNELLKRGENILNAVYTASTQVCRQRYSKPCINEDSHLELYRRCRKLFDNRQMHALKMLYRWRDEHAREEDESIGFVLPNHMLLQIAELLPREMQGILACCNPIPPLVRSNLLDIHRLVLQARDQPLVKPILTEEARARGSTQHTLKINIDSVLNCPHDLSRTEEFRDNLPTLLDNFLKPTKLINTSAELENSQASLSVYNSENKTERKNRINPKIQRLKFLGPYERYKLVKSFVQAQEQKQEDNDKEDESNKTEDTAKERSDNERIAALQEHFKKLASTTEQLVPIQKKHSPVSLGQSLATKRKRESSPEEQEATIKQLSAKQPNKKKKNKNKNKHNMQALNCLVKNKKSKNKQTPANQPQKQPGHSKKQQSQQNHSNSNRKRQWNVLDEDLNVKKSRYCGNTDKFETFDYSTVDFKRYQGGAGSSQSKKISTNFKAKDSKNKKFDNIGRNNIRSSSFSGRGGKSRTGNKKQQTGW